MGARHGTPRLAGTSARWAPKAPAALLTRESFFETEGKKKKKKKKNVG
jgi:hypothetical protein